MTLEFILYITCINFCSTVLYSCKTVQTNNAVIEKIFIFVDIFLLYNFISCLKYFKGNVSI